MLRLLALLPVALLSLVTAVPFVNRCEEGCRVIKYPTNPLFGCTVTGDLPQSPGHGICACLFTTCVDKVPCAESITITVDAGSNYLCGSSGLLGHNETFDDMTVFGCGDAEVIHLDVRSTNSCLVTDPPNYVGTITIGIVCLWCDGTC
jgi:hypothetical protein